MSEISKKHSHFLDVTNELTLVANIEDMVRKAADIRTTAMEPSAKQHLLQQLENQIATALVQLEGDLERSRLASLPVPVSASLSDSAYVLLDLTDPTPTPREVSAELCLTVPLSIVPTTTLRTFTSNTVAHAVEDTESQATQSLADKNIISSADLTGPLATLAGSLNNNQPLVPDHYFAMNVAISKLAGVAKADSLSVLDETRAQKSFSAVATRVDAQGNNVWSSTG